MRLHCCTFPTCRHMVTGRVPAVGIAIVMAAHLLLCDQPNCSESACVFGFTASKQKTKFCQQHMSLLTDKQLPVFDILSFNFIRKAEEAAFCDWTPVQGKYSGGEALEARCRGGLNELESRLQVAKASMLSAVERSFHDMEERARQRYEATKNELTRRRSDLINMVQGGQLPKAEEIAMWEEGAKSSLTDYFLGGPPPDSPLAAFCKVPPEESGETPTLLKPPFPFDLPKSTATTESDKHKFSFTPSPVFSLTSVSQASTAFQPPPTFTPHFGFKPPPSLMPPPMFKPPPAFMPPAILTQLGIPPSLGPLTPIEQQFQAAASSLLKAGLDVQADYQKIMHPPTFQNPELRLQLGLVLSNFVEKSEADSVLRRSMDLQTNPSPELTLQLSNCLAEAYYQAGWWSETVDVCERTLQTWGKGAYGFELFRALYFLTCSLYSAGKTSQGLALAREWTAKLPTDSPTSKSLLLFIQAEQHRVQGKDDEAVRCYESGLVQGLKLLPHSYVTACSSRWLGLIYETQQKWRQAETHLLQAKQIFAQVFPQSLDFANCLHNVGELYCLQERANDAAESCLQACQIYSAHSPQSLEFANCLKDLGLVYESLERWEQAEERYLQACLIYTAHFPLSLDFAGCLQCLGNLCKATKRPERAEEHYMKACQIYAGQFYQASAVCYHQH